MRLGLQGNPSGKVLSATASILLLVLVWIPLVVWLRWLAGTLVVLAFCLLMFVLMVREGACGLAPAFTSRQQWMVVALTTAKVLASLTYFNSFFVIGGIDGDMSVMGNYGDSSLYHQRALDIASSFSLQIDSLLGKLHVCLEYEGFLGNIQMLNARSGAQWGYPLFLAVLYFVAGNNPLVGIVANALLMFFTVMVFARLFIACHLPATQVRVAVWLLLLWPGLWAWSSLLYKDALLYFLVSLALLFIARILRSPTMGAWAGLLTCLCLILPVRYSYVAPLAVAITLGRSFIPAADGAPRGFWHDLSIRILLAAFALIILDGLFGFLTNYPSIIFSLKGLLAAEPTGGRFMSAQSSIVPSTVGGIALIPLRIIYILLVPFPWFGGTFPLEKFDFTVWHADALMGMWLVSAVAIVGISYRSFKIDRFAVLLLLVGLIYLALPAFFYWPDRRYTTIAMPIVLAFAAPILGDRVKLLQSVAVALSVIATVLLVYEFGYVALLNMVRSLQR
jgi:hypothetical protein